MTIAVGMCSLEDVFIKIARSANDPVIMGDEGASTAVRGKVGTSSTIVQVVCPDGAGTGDLITVAALDGSVSSVVVPAGAIPLRVFQATVAHVSTSPPPVWCMTTLHAIVPAVDSGNLRVEVPYPTGGSNVLSMEVPVPNGAVSGTPFHSRYTPPPKASTADRHVLTMSKPDKASPLGVTVSNQDNDETSAPAAPKVRRLLSVASLAQGGIAHTSGLCVGDAVVSINGKPTTGMTPDQCTALLKKALEIKIEVDRRAVVQAAELMVAVSSLPPPPPAAIGRPLNSGTTVPSRPVSPLMYRPLTTSTEDQTGGNTAPAARRPAASTSGDAVGTAEAGVQMSRSISPRSIRSPERMRSALSSAGVEDVLAADELGDPDGLLTDTLPFAPTPFPTQMKAAFIKYATFQRRQYCANVSQCLVILMLLGLLFVAQSIIGFIIGGTIIICSDVRTYPMDTADWITSPNQERVDKLVGNLTAKLRSDLTGCERNSADAKDQRNFAEWGYNSLCCNLNLCRPSSGARDKLDEMLDRFECDKDLYDSLKDDYKYVRSSNSPSKTCDVSRRPNVTTTIGGVTIERTSVVCMNAWFLVAQTCQALPATCLTKDDVEYKVAVELEASYDCKLTAGHVMHDVWYMSRDVCMFLRLQSHCSHRLRAVRLVSDL